MSTSPCIRKKGKREDEKVKSMEESSIKSATTHEPASQASTRPTPNHLPKTSSTNLAPSRPLPNPHLAASPAIDGQSESGSDAPSPPANQLSTAVPNVNSEPNAVYALQKT
ncbi:hypothetical protein M405DRAFT_363390 [Rhizopogon salebrosus TDB-379]|nr:hypothetical protein M405DRAFT_363390 [Rhizopogon salebrosus TDB-379]